MADLHDEFEDKRMFQKILFRANADVTKSIRDYARDCGLETAELIAESMSIPADGVLPVLRTFAWALPYSSAEDWEGDRRRFRVSLREACLDADMPQRQVTETEVGHLADQFLRRWFGAEKKRRTAELGTADPNDKPKDKLKDINSLLFTATPEAARAMKDYNSDYSDRIASKIAVELNLVAEEVGFTLRAGLMGIRYANERDWAISRRVFRDELQRACDEAGLHEQVVVEKDVDRIFAMFIRSWQVFEKRWSDFRLVFEREDVIKGKKIEARMGWYLEYMASGLMFYPSPWLKYSDRRWKELIADKYRSWQKPYQKRFLPEGMYVLYHVYEPSPDGGTRHAYYANGQNGKIGEAEYRGRRAGARPGETERRIGDEIALEIIDRAPTASVETTVKSGEYRAFMADPQGSRLATPEEKSMLAEVEAEFRKRYPLDRFEFYWGGAYDS